MRVPITGEKELYKRRPKGEGGRGPLSPKLPRRSCHTDCTLKPKRLHDLLHLLCLAALCTCSMLFWTISYNKWWDGRLIDRDRWPLFIHDVWLKHKLVGSCGTDQQHDNSWDYRCIYLSQTVSPLWQKSALDILPRASISNFSCSLSPDLLHHSIEEHGFS